MLIDLNLAFYGVEYLVLLLPLWVYSRRYTVRGFVNKARSHL